jgi:crotonobetainyl-CoA:carnitine CoA-transferase CaiB-like acyl-CoA transferase
MVGGMLADFGANVIKVEDPKGGDPLRRLPPHQGGQALWSKVTNRNKKSISLNLRSDRGRELFKRLVALSDVVIVNFRPATLAGWRLDYEDLIEAKPDIIMLHITGFGRTGPHKDRPGFARIAEAYSGLTYCTGFPDGPPVFSGYPLADGIAGPYGAFSVMLALYHRQLTGQGQLIDLALYEPVLRMLEDSVVAYDVGGHVRERVGNINPYVAPNDLYETAEGRWIVLPASTQNMWSRLCKALGRHDLARDPRFKDNPSRVENRDALDRELRPEIAKRNAEELFELLHEAGVAVGPVNSVADLVEDPHVWERGSLIKVLDENLEREVAMQGVFPLLSQSPGTIHGAGPEPGQQTLEVLSQQLGMSEVEVLGLVNDGVVGLGVERPTAKAQGAQAGSMEAGAWESSEASARRRGQDG